MGTAEPIREEPPCKADDERGLTEIRPVDAGERTSVPERAADRGMDPDSVPIRRTLLVVLGDEGLVVMGARRTGWRLGVTAVRRLSVGAAIRLALLLEVVFVLG